LIYSGNFRLQLVKVFLQIFHCRRKFIFLKWEIVEMAKTKTATKPPAGADAYKTASVSFRHKDTSL